VPELPEVESARAVIERAALGREIVDADDSDTYVTRPHRAGELRAALVGRRLTAAHRRGKSMWFDTSGTADSAAAGPTLGIHLGMSGKIVIADGQGAEIEGGDYWQRGRASGDHRFTRFSLTFADGGSLLLIDPRRLGRARGEMEGEFRAAFLRGTAPVKARLLDQNAIAGVGNLIADQVLWTAKIHPARPVGELDQAEVDRLYRAVRRYVQSTVANGGVHTLPIVEYRKAGARCPRDGAPMAHGTIGGRTTWWCSREQVETG
jgi:formamidopyrimidine-DNA glycosylase